MCPGSVRVPGPVKKRLPIKAKTKHQVQLKYSGRCGFIDQQGERCKSRRFLEVHHIQPVSRGGNNNLDNLILLCSGHHKIYHQVDGDEGEDGKLPLDSS